MRGEERAAHPLRCTECKYLMKYEKAGRMERVCVRIGVKFGRVPASHPRWCPLRGRP